MSYYSSYRSACVCSTFGDGKKYTLGSTQSTSLKELETPTYTTRTSLKEESKMYGAFRHVDTFLTKVACGGKVCNIKRLETCLGECSGNTLLSKVEP